LLDYQITESGVNMSKYLNQLANDCIHKYVEEFLESDSKTIS